jgi:hypothetical protein
MATMSLTIEPADAKAANVDLKQVRKDIVNT